MSNKMNVPGEFKFRQRKDSFDLTESEVTNDVRYQECTEITLDLNVLKRQTGQGLFLFYAAARRGGFLFAQIRIPLQ